MPINTDKNNSSSRNAIEPEVLQPENTQQQYRSWTYAQQPGNFGRFAIYNNSGCIAASITFGIFIVCLAQYGLLAAIGFFVFHIIGSVICSMLITRALMTGRPVNIWNGRILNWLFSFLLTVWLAGGLD